VALMMPLLELAGDFVCRIPTVLYVYNVATPYNDYKTQLDEQSSVDQIVRMMSTRERVVPGTFSPDNERVSIDELHALSKRVGMKKYT